MRSQFDLVWQQVSAEDKVPVVWIWAGSMANKLTDHSEQTVLRSPTFLNLLTVMLLSSEATFAIVLLCLLLSRGVFVAYGDTIRYIAFAYVLLGITCRRYIERNMRHTPCTHKERRILHLWKGVMWIAVMILLVMVWNSWGG